MAVGFSILEQAANKMLEGDLAMASSYFDRARAEGIPSTIVNLRYLTKNYLVYPLEYEGATYYFDCLTALHKLVKHDEAYVEEYKRALATLVDFKRVFLRAVALFYFSDIAVCSTGSTVVKEIFSLYTFLKANKDSIALSDVYEIKTYLPTTNMQEFTTDLDKVIAFCLNLLLSYTAEQHSVYSGKKYSVTTIDYGYFYSTEVSARDQYYNYANIKPRLFLILGHEAYYYELLEEYKAKLAELHGFDSPTVLREELKKLINLKDKSDESAKAFIKYAKLFEKTDDSRDSYIKWMLKYNPFTKPFKGFYQALFGMDSVGSFELNEYFPRKMLTGVCTMISYAYGWKLETVRWATIFLGACFIGVLGYVALALAMKAGYYFGVNVEKP